MSPTAIVGNGGEANHRAEHSRDVMVPKVGIAFGQYELVRALGRGGMGEVFLARDVLLGRRVAIKFLSQERESLAARFLAEARATARCRHENIVVVHDLGEVRGRSYMVLEYIAGTTLRDWLRDHWEPDGWARGGVGLADPLANTQAPPRVSTALAREVIVPVVRALAHAHGRGLVHRDLKPENIMLSRDGSIKVLDFGVAKVFDSGAYLNTSVHASDPSQNSKGDTPEAGQVRAGASRIAQTKAGALVGTLPYMAPEQLVGGVVDERCDLWAVGIILWELLTGRHPLAPVTLVRLMEVEELDRPMPSILSVRPELGRLGEMIDSCLQKHRKRRISSAAELLKTLMREGPNLSRSVDSADGAPGVEVGNPYAGLAAFQESDAGRFFGRENDIASLITQLRLHRMCAVVGPSGAGKSSFIRAGAIPALKRLGQGWDAVIVRPGREPLAALARALATMEPSVLSDSSEADRQQVHLDKLHTQPGYLGTVLRHHCRQRHGSCPAIC